MPTPSQEPCNRQSAGDGKLTNGYWNQGRNQASESQQQKRQCARNHETLGVLHVVGASFSNVEVKWRLSRQFELHPWIAAPELVLKRALQLMKFRDERLYGPLARGESYQDKSSPSLAQENLIVKIKTGNNSGYARFLLQPLFNRC